MESSRLQELEQIPGVGKTVAQVAVQLGKSRQAIYDCLKCEGVTI